MNFNSVESAIDYLEKKIVILTQEHHKQNNRINTLEQIISDLFSLVGNNSPDLQQLIDKYNNIAKK